MPKLPDLNSLGARPAPEPSLAVADYSAAGDAAGKALQAQAAVGAEIRQQGEQIQQVHDNFDLAQAKSFMARESADASTMFDGDQDYATYVPRYDEKIKNAAKQAEAMISNPQAKALFAMDTEGDYLRGLGVVKGKARQQEGDVGRANLTTGLNDNLTAMGKAADEGQRVALINTSKDLIRGAKGRGWLTAEQEVEEFDKFRKTAVDRHYIDKIATDPEAVVRETAPMAVTPEMETAAGDVVAKAAAKHGADPTVMAKTMAIESGGNPNAVSPTGAKGAFQFTGGTAREYGLTDPNNLEESADKAAQLQVDNTKVLTKKLGRSPAGAEIYLAHQQGATGASALVNHPEKNAIQALEDAGVSADKAQQSILVNGGTTEMTAQEFTGMWKQKYDAAEAPRHVYVKTGAMADELGAEREKTYQTAAKQVVANRMATDPLSVPKLLEDPAYKAAFTPDEVAKLKADARTQFAALDDSARTDKIMKQANANRETFDAFQAGNLTNSRLSQLEAAGEVDHEVANYMRGAMVARAPKRTALEMSDALVNLNMRLTDFGVKGSGTKAKATSSTAEDLLTFQRDVTKNMMDGFITPGQARDMFANIDTPLAKKVSGAGQYGMWEHTMGGEPNAYQKGFQSINTWFDVTSKQEDNIKGKAEMMRRFTLILNEVPADKRDDKAVTDALNLAAKSYRQTQFSVLQMMDEIPNGIIQPGAVKTSLVPQSNAKPEATVKANYKLGRDRKSGTVVRVYDDGVIEAAPTEEAATLKAKGY